ncbi:VanZ family protein [Arthrobacter sp. Rue61a]|jgi:glycopeptide antibiotics resistance protein|uniref:VanZ-like family protein n=1 Tax=Paenarthrobacter aurescens (strain TC1) TaxID=290340 RepID=A1R9L7_PAEAT|nr:MULTISPECIES: VanZ family protein [Micrococcaceae]ABM08335.1 putative VanZ-like family protein [Paenarthrobacter aurescens TC1]
MIAPALPLDGSADAYLWRPRRQERPAVLARKYSTWWLKALFIAYLVSLAFVVFLPAREASTVTGFVGVIAGWLSFLGLPPDAAGIGVEFVANIVLFVPFGAFVRLLRPGLWSWWTLALLAAASSGTIEVLQLAIPGRVTALSDVIANTLGALAGLAVAKRLA